MKNKGKTSQHLHVLRLYLNPVEQGTSGSRQKHSHICSFQTLSRGHSVGAWRHLHWHSSGTCICQKEDLINILYVRFFFKRSFHLLISFSVIWEQQGFYFLASFWKLAILQNHPYIIINYYYTCKLLQCSGRTTHPHSQESCSCATSLYNVHVRYFLQMWFNRPYSRYVVLLL